MAGDLTRAVLGTRGRLLGVVGTLLLLVVAVPICLLVFGLIVPAVASLVVGLLGLGVVVMALLPGRRWH